MEGAVWCLVVAMAVGSSGQAAVPSYSVVAPSTIRPNTDYFAAITMGGITGDLQVSKSKCMFTPFPGGAMSDIWADQDRAEY